MKDTRLLSFVLLSLLSEPAEGCPACLSVLVLFNVYFPDCFLGSNLGFSNVASTLNGGGTSYVFLKFSKILSTVGSERIRNHLRNRYRAFIWGRHLAG